MSMKKTWFAEMFADADELTFQESWNNGTGYFDGAVRADLGLEPGQMTSSWTGEVNNRRLLIVGTRFGNVVVFERYTAKGEDRCDKFCINAPYEIKALFGAQLGTALTDDAFQMVLGSAGFGNIGKRLEEAFSAETV